LSDVNLNSIDAVILCGGLGKRLRPVIGESPKPMAEVHEEPFLNIVLKHLREQGIKRAVLCAGYKGEVIEEYYRRHDLGMEIVVSLEKSPLGTGGAIGLARKLIASQPFLVLNGDSFCPVDYRKFLEFHQTTKALASMVIVQIKDQKDFGVVALDGAKRIVGFFEKSYLKDQGKGVTVGINAGIYLFNQDIFSVLPPQSSFGLEYDVFPKMVNQDFYGFEVQESFIDIGTPERFKQAQTFIK
jgi:D-glycero-alpha-D-manno-heptose 1-phosphate guanylyltransferase